MYAGKGILLSILVYCCSSIINTFSKSVSFKETFIQQTLPIQIQPWKHCKKVRKLFKVNNSGTNEVIDVVPVSFLLAWNVFHIFV